MLAVGFFTAGCQQDEFRTSPTIPYVPPGNGYQAPPPPNGFQPPVQPPIGPGPVFRPQVPPQMPPQFYPFAPVYQYMQMNFQLQQQWMILWQRWQQFAQWNAVNQYNFAMFWTQFCPQQPEFRQVYGYLDQSFYYWVTPETYFPPQADCATYWNDWNYYPYECYDYCY